MVHILQISPEGLVLSPQVPVNLVEVVVMKHEFIYPLVIKGSLLFHLYLNLINVLALMLLVSQLLCHLFDLPILLLSQLHLPFQFLAELGKFLLKNYLLGFTRLSLVL